MWIETNKDLTILCQGMGDNAFVFYHRFWGVVAIASCPSAEQVVKDKKLHFTLSLSQQARASEIERLIKKYWGNQWGQYVFDIEYINADNVGQIDKLTIRKIER